MSKIIRKTQLQFGSSAGTGDGGIGQFGSLAASSPTHSLDPAVIQALSNYLGGLASAVVGPGDSIALDDLNGLFYLIAYQLGYIFQEGVSEYDSGTTYFTGSLVNNAGAIYQSLIDSNVGNALTNTSKWVAGAKGDIPIGGVIATFPNLTGAYSTTATTAADAMGFVLCQGQTISDSNSPMNGQVVPDLHTGVFLYGNSSAGSTGGSATSNALIAHTHAAGTFGVSLSLMAGSVSLTGSTTFASGDHVHNMAHTHQALDSSGGGIYGTQTSDPSNIDIDNTFQLMIGSTTCTSGTSAADAFVDLGNHGAYYTSGIITGPGGSYGATAVTAAPSSTASVGVSYSHVLLNGVNTGTVPGTGVSGTSASAGSGSSFSILPPYINTVYLMRIR